ncbi:unnamed protein product [Paramecium primaurelia]|uniref:Uncharacterized protein n=1 Tax=Paramecium primaurelia TaxID=5886 RepID=A0A8S1NZI9_PARPR|nr:unnamed protein product [Paramecium primaurelia]
MSSNISNASVKTNEITNMIAEYNFEEEMLEIAALQQTFSDQFDELVGINIQALEEKQKKDQKLNKMKYRIRKSTKQIRKGKKINQSQVKKQSIVERSPFNTDYINNHYFEIKKYQGEWQKQEQEAFEEQFAIPLYQNGFQTQKLFYKDQQDIMDINRLDLSINRSINNLNKNSMNLSSSSSNLSSI